MQRLSRPGGLDQPIQFLQVLIVTEYDSPGLTKMRPNCLGHFELFELRTRITGFTQGAGAGREVQVS